jgi:tetratricopeptide (TPR) repeat protein
MRYDLLHDMRLRQVIAITCGLAGPILNASSGPDPGPALQRIREKVAEISANRTPDEVRRAIAEWKQREPNSPTPYIVAANYEYGLSRQPTAVAAVAVKKGSKIPNEKELGLGKQFSVVDPKTGKEVGVFGEFPTGPKPNANTARAQKLRGAAELEAALYKFPNRLDIMLGRSIMLEDAREWKALMAQLEMALQQSVQQPETLRWLEDNLPPSPPAEEVTGKVQEFFRNAIMEKSKAGDARAKKLAELGLKYYPQHVPFLSDLGTLAAWEHDSTRAIEIYEKARKLAPKDSIVLGNLARMHLNLGHVAEAGEIANEVIKLNNDSQATAEAKEILAEIIKKGRK